MTRYNRCKSDFCRRIALPGRDGYCDLCYKVMIDKKQLELLKQISNSISELNQKLSNVTVDTNNINIERKPDISQSQENDPMFIPSIDIDDSKTNLSKLETTSQAIRKDLNNIIEKLKQLEGK